MIVKFNCKMLVYGNDNLSYLRYENKNKFN